jgi:hypothetical protein
VSNWTQSISRRAHALGKQFHSALSTGDLAAIRTLLHDDATWTLPGDNAVSGMAVGADAVVERARTIADGYLSRVCRLCEGNIAAAARRDSLRTCPEKVQWLCAPNLYHHPASRLLSGVVHGLSAKGARPLVDTGSRFAHR